MFNARLAAAVLIVALFGLGGRLQEPPRPAAAPQITYDGFMKLNAEQRQKRFQELTPETKASLKRELAEQWLSKNRSRLTDAQVVVVLETIAFLSPDMYRNPEDPVLRQKEQELTKKLECVLGVDRAVEAFTFMEPNPPRNLAGLIDTWFTWFTECVMKQQEAW